VLVFSTSIAMGEDSEDAVVAGFGSASSSLLVVDGLGGRMSGKRREGVAEPAAGHGSGILSVELRVRQ
jgi:hypothetical protein